MPTKKTLAQVNTLANRTRSKCLLLFYQIVSICKAHLKIFKLLANYAIFTKKKACF